MAAKGKKIRFQRREPIVKSSLVSKLDPNIFSSIIDFKFSTGPQKPQIDMLEFELLRKFTQSGGTDQDIKDIKGLKADELKVFFDLVGHDYETLDYIKKTADLKRLFYLVKKSLNNDELVENIINLARQLNDPELEDVTEKTNLIKKIAVELEKVALPNANQQEIIGELRNFIKSIPKQPTSEETRQLGLVSETSETRALGQMSETIPPRSGSSIVSDVSGSNSFNIFEGTFSQKAAPPPSSYSSFGSTGTAFQFPLSASSQGSIGFRRPPEESPYVLAGKSRTPSGYMPPQYAQAYQSVPGQEQYFATRFQGQAPQVATYSSATYSAGPTIEQIANMETKLTEANINDNLDQELARRLLHQTPYIYDAFEIPDKMYDDLVATRNKAYYMANMSQLEQDRKNRMNQEIQNRATLQKEYDLRFVTPLCPENHGAKSFVK